MTNELHGRRADEEAVSGEPDFAHPARAKRADQVVAADRERFVQLLPLDLEDGALADEHRSFEYRSQLADVSAPGVRFEATHRVGRHTVDHLAQPSRMPADEMIDECRYVLSPVD